MRHLCVSVRRKRNAPVGRAASGQWGYLTTEQLMAFGWSRSVVDRGVREGWLWTRYRGVHAVGHKPRSREGEWAAALLACGPTAVLSHLDAGAVHGFLDRHHGWVHVTTTARRRGHRGIELHWSRRLDGQVMRRRGFPVTDPYRTLVDLGDLLDGDALLTVAQRAEHLGHVDLRKLRCPPGRGSAALRHVLAAVGEGTRSRLERRFFALCADAGLPRPEVNARIGRYRPDFLWRAQRFIVETDGYEAHRGRAAFERDRRRIAAFVAQGHDVLPTTWRQVTDDPALLVAALRTKLA